MYLNGTDVYCTADNRRLVYDFSMKAFKPAKKHLLTPAMKAKRLAFAKQLKTGMKQGIVKLFSWINPQPSNLHGENDST